MRVDDGASNVWQALICGSGEDEANTLLCDTCDAAGGLPRTFVYRQAQLKAALRCSVG